MRSLRSLSRDDMAGGWEMRGASLPQFEPVSVLRRDGIIYIGGVKESFASLGVLNAARRE